MPINPLRPNWLKIKYITGGVAHTATIPFRLATWDGTFNGSVEFNCWDGTGRPEDVVIPAYVDLLRPFHATGTQFVQYETWQQVAVGDPPVLMSQRPMVLTGSVGGVAINPLSMQTYTFKTLGGGRFNLRHLGLVESMFGVTASLYQNLNSAAGLNASITALRDYILGDTHAFSGRDNTRPVLALNVSHKISDTLRKRAMRLGEIA